MNWMNCFEYLGRIFLVFGSIMSKFIIFAFTTIGAIATIEYLMAHYPMNMQIIYCGTILIWLLLGGIYEYNKLKKEEYAKARK